MGHLDGKDMELLILNKMLDSKMELMGFKEIEIEHTLDQCSFHK